MENKVDLTTTIDIKRLLKLLNKELSKEGKKASIFICGGAVMELVFNVKRTTDEFLNIVDKYVNTNMIYPSAYKRIIDENNLI